MNGRLFLAGAVAAGICAAALIAAPVRITPELREIDLPTETTTKALRLAVMEFTPEQADAVLGRIAEEKREAQRKAEEATRRRAVSYDTSATYSAAYFRSMGVIYWGSWRWTWYSERVLPGSGLRIPGRHTDSAGYVRDGDGYICLASDALARGTVIATPFGGAGRVYDSGCGYGTVDVYVGW